MKCAIKIKKQKFYFKTFAGDTDCPSWTKKKNEIHIFQSREDAEVVLQALSKLSKINWNVEIVEFT